MPISVGPVSPSQPQLFLDRSKSPALDCLFLLKHPNGVEGVASIINHWSSWSLCTDPSMLTGTSQWFATIVHCYPELVHATSYTLHATGIMCLSICKLHNKMIRMGIASIHTITLKVSALQQPAWQHLCTTRDTLISMMKGSEANFMLPLHKLNSWHLWREWDGLSIGVAENQLLAFLAINKVYIMLVDFMI
jgi:hypothetical protein